MKSAMGGRGLTASSSLSDFARTAAENADLAGISPEFASGMSTYHPEFGENPNSNLDSLARTLKVRQAARQGRIGGPQHLQLR
jgi:hypothetical protein